MSASRSYFLSASVGSALVATLAAHSQTAYADPADTSEPAGLEEIIVTAQKRAQKISDVGATIDVVTGKDMQNLGITAPDQLAAVVPGFTAAVSQTGAPLFALRGINFNAAQFTAPPAVSVYVDEVPLPYSFMTPAAFLDVDHIEVVKGPQGTLFGENSTGGSINVIAAKPTSAFTFGTELSVSNFGQVENQSHIGGALTSTLNARLAVSTTQFGTWQKPYFEGVNDNGRQNKAAARLLLDWAPVDRLTVSLNVNGNYDHGELQQPQFRLFTPAVAGGANPLLATYPVPTDARDADLVPGFNTHKDNRLYQTAGRIEYELNNDNKLILITNYTNAEIRAPLNLAGTALPGVDTISTVTDSMFSQELRLSGNTPDKRVTYIVGGNFENNNMLEQLYQDFFSYSGLPTGAQLNSPFKIGARYIAAFGNVDFKIAEPLTLTAGARYTSARETRKGCTADGGNGITSAVIGGASDFFRSLEGLPPSGAFGPGQCITLDDTGAAPTYLPLNLNNVQKENNVSWRSGLNYQPDANTLLYALVSRGYKAGVWLVNDLILNSAAVPVKQEELTSYEGGAKLNFFDHRLQLNTALFYYDYKNKQFSTIAPSFLGGVFIIKNIPTSKAYGLDLDFSARPTRELTLRGAVTYLHSRIGPFIGYDHVTLQPIQYDGSQFSYAPQWSATFGAEYRISLTDKLNGFLGGNGNYVGRTWGDLGESPNTLIPQYTTLNFFAGVESSQGWRASLWVRNATDKFYLTSTAPSGDTLTQMAGLPRTYGVTVGYQF
jgi:outer membrane receptor protein involved in Fe transport